MIEISKYVLCMVCKLLNPNYKGTSATEAIPHHLNHLAAKNVAKEDEYPQQMDESCLKAKNVWSLKGAQNKMTHVWPLPSLTFRLDLGRAVRNSAKLVEPKSDDSEQSWRIVLPIYIGSFDSSNRNCVVSGQYCLVHPFAVFRDSQAMQNFRFVG